MVRIIHRYKDFSSVKRQFQWCVLYLGAYYNREITVNNKGVSTHKPIMDEATQMHEGLRPTTMNHPSMFQTTEVTTA